RPEHVVTLLRSEPWASPLSVGGSALCRRLDACMSCRIVQGSRGIRLPPSTGTALRFFQAWTCGQRGPGEPTPNDSCRTPQQGEGKSMTERELGTSGLKVSAIGLGCMGMSGYYDPRHLNDEESVRVIHRYLDAGGNFLDTADVYGVGQNEALVGKAIRGRRDGVVVATKFGNVWGTGAILGVRGDPAYVRACCDASLRRPGVDVINLYYQHR